MKQIVKVTLWATLCFVFILVIVFSLIQVPVIQTKIVQKATTLISNKTHTRVELEKVSISFPKLIVIEGLYLEDTQKDTLIYAGKAKVNIALFDLFSSKITINSFILNDATIKLYSTKTDPSFNYNFLTTAFADTTIQQEADTRTAKNWTFSLDKVHLRNFRLTFNDDFAGMNVFVLIENSGLNFDEINLEKSVYAIDEMFLEGLTANVQQLKTTNIKNKNSGNVMPKISAKNLQINNSTLSYTDSVGNLSVNIGIGQSELQKAFIDLQKEMLTTDYISLSKSEIRYHSFTPETITDPIGTDAPSDNNWEVAVNSLFFNDNKFTYKVGEKPSLKDEFDPDNLSFDQMNLTATDFYYATNLTKISVSKFNAINQGNFVINSLATDFSMDEHSISTNNLKLKTPDLTIDADFNIHYSSMEAFAKSYRFSNLNLNMRNVTFKNPGVLYFSPNLAEQPFFRTIKNITTISGKVNGPMNYLTGKNLVVKTGENTLLETDFTITGLPDTKKAVFNFPNLKIHSGKKDVVMMAGSSIPENIELPEKISLQIAFNGTMKSFETTAIMNSSFGDAKLAAAIDAKENFNGNVSINNLDLGKILKDSLFYGPVSLTAKANGQGSDIETIKANIRADATQLYLNQYNYQHLTLNGAVSGRQFEGKINLDDENAAFEFDGLVNVNPGQEQYKFRLNVPGADLQKLHLIEKEVSMSFVAEADLKGSSVNTMNGTAGINNIIIINRDKTYRLESLLAALVNGPDKSELNISSALIGVNYSGTLSPAELPEMLTKFANNYFPVSDSLPPATNNKQAKFNFEIMLNDHPIITEVLFPEINEFIPGIITGSFDSEKNELKLNAGIKKIVYGTTEINDAAMAVNSDQNALNFIIGIQNISNAQMGIEHLLIEGKLANQKIATTISSVDKKLYKKLMISTQLSKEANNYKLKLNPANFYLMNKQWDIAADNCIEFGQEGLKIHHLYMNHAESRFHIESANNRFNDNLNITFHDFKLSDLSGIVTKDSALVKGTVDGNAIIMRTDGLYGIVADATIDNLFVGNIPIGNLKVKAENTTHERFNFDVNLLGAGNNLTTKGYYIPNGGTNAINMKTEIESLSMKTLEVFSMGQITEATGMLNGEFLITGNTGSPDITGQLTFNNAFLKPAFLNNRIELKHETMQLKNDGIYFNNFTVLDPEQNTAILNGAVKMKQFSKFNFDFNITTKDFLLFNTTVNNSKDFFGQMIIDSHIDVSGPMKLPVVKARLKMKKGSNFTFIVPENRYTTDKGEDVVEFEPAEKLNPILSHHKKTEAQKSEITGFDLAAIIEIDKEATLRLLMDPASTDSLVVKGEAALSFTMDQSGKMSLTGAYNLNEGSYLVSLESIFKKRFDLDAGSTIIWNGDPMDADININAGHIVRASPFDLVADQISGLSDVDKGLYKQRFPFIVLLKLRGKILQPEISFEIKLPPEESGIIGGSVNQKLSILNDDPSALNKQVFALLVLGRFIQENPFQSDIGSASSLIRTTVGRFLSEQLNQLSAKVIPGVELNFDIQSYDDYQSGQAQGRTQVEIGVKKQLFNERLSVQLGGTVDVEGDMAKQNSASDITSDVMVEYKLNKDGTFRLKGFRHNQYEGAIEGQLVETGIGVVYVKDFNRWRRFFGTKRKPENLFKKNE